MVDRIRVRVGPHRDRLLEPSAGPAVEGRELRRPEPLVLARAEDDAHPLRQEPLDALELVRVERELENRVRLRAPRELRVPGLVGEGAEPGRLVDADEEVGDATPALGGENALVDDVDACPERLLGAAGSLGETVLTEADLDDVATLCDEPCEEGRLVLVALACDELGVCVVARRRQRDLSALDRRSELGQVRAGEVGREVGRGEKQRAVVGESHHSSISRSAATAYAGSRSRTQCSSW